MTHDSIPLADGVVGIYGVGPAASHPEGLDLVVVLGAGDTHDVDLPGEVAYAPAPDLASPMTVGRRWAQRSADGTPGRSVRGNTLASRWVMRERGLALSGPPASSLVAPVDAAGLRAEALGQARALAEALEDGAAPDKQPVVRACRLLHTAVTATVVDDVTAARAVAPELAPDVGDVVVLTLAGHVATERRVRGAVWELHRLIGEVTLRARG